MTDLPAIALDLSRLALAPVRRVPRGIDRVELAYARHFLRVWPGECWTVLPMPWGIRCYDRKQSLKFLGGVERLWRETVDPSQDEFFARTKSFLAGHETAAGPPARKLKLTNFERAHGYVSLLGASGIVLGDSVKRVLPEGAIYLNVGQLEVFRPFLTWLHRRPDVRSVFMFHDVIPLELPQHHTRMALPIHRAIVRNTAEFAQAVIVPSETAKQSIGRELDKHRSGGLPIHVELLPVSEEFLVRSPDDPELSKANYFIICGAIDSYKNHLLLLEIWEQLVARHGNAAPKLVVAGTPGSTSQHVIEFFQQHASIHKHVTMSSGLSTPALRQLIAGARALLMPSLAEGFGLPVVEALAQNTHVVASDIPAHREAGAGGDVTFLDPRDREKWLSCVERLANAPRTGRSPQSGPYRPKTWADYFESIERFLIATEMDKKRS